MAERTGIALDTWHMGGEILDNMLDGLNMDTGGVQVIKTRETVWKATGLINNNVAKNICTLRDPEEALALRRIDHPEEAEIDSIKIIKSGWDNCKRYNDHTLWLDYRDIVRDPVSQIIGIGKHLLIDVPLTIANSIREALDYEGRDAEGIGAKQLEKYAILYARRFDSGQNLLQS